MEILLFCIITISLVLGFISTSGSKSQHIRLLDIFIIGPLMIYFGYSVYLDTGNWLALILLFFGGTTITYNLRNYIAAY